MSGSPSCSIPGASTILPIVLAPAEAGEIDATLTLESNDLDEPVIEVALEVSVPATPGFLVSPPSLTSALSSGVVEEHLIVLSNVGAATGTFAISVDPAASFLHVGPLSGSVSQGGSVALEILLDGLVSPGTHQTTIEIATDDPQHSLIEIPVTLVVSGAAHMILGVPILESSSIDFDSAGARTIHVFPGLPAVSHGSLVLRLEGDFDSSNETANLSLGGQNLGSFGDGTGFSCTSITSFLSVPRTLINAAGGDGVLEFELQNSAAVSVGCPNNRHVLELDYLGLDLPLDFGEVIAGQTATMPLEVRSGGTGSVIVPTISSDAPEFVPSVESGGANSFVALEFDVAFTPSTTGPFTGTLTLHSNDADQPVVMLPMVGLGVPPPVVSVDPAALGTNLGHGALARLPLTISNSGASTLSFSVDVRPSGVLSQAPEPGSSGSGFALYASRLGGGLYRIDPASGASAGVLANLEGTILGLAFDRQTGALYAASSAASRLWSIDVATGSTDTLTTIYPQTEFEALDIDAAGRMYAAVGFEGFGAGGLAIWEPDDDTFPAGEFDWIGSFGNGIGESSDSPGIRALAFDAEGRLYAASGPAADGSGGTLYLVDPESAAAAPIGPIVDSVGTPIGGGVGALQFGPDGVLYGGTMADPGWLIAIDPDTGVFQPIGTSLEGGFGALAAFGAEVTLSFLGVEPSQGTLAPGGSTTVDVVFDASDPPPGGPYLGAIVVTSNDPASPEIGVLASLTVEGVPEVARLGARLSLESQVPADGPYAHSQHEFVVAAPPLGTAVVEVFVEGTFESPSQYASVWAEGQLLGHLGDMGHDCDGASRVFLLDDGELLDLAADGLIGITVSNSLSVEPCGSDEHTVRLELQLAEDSPLDYGSMLVGQTRALPLKLGNLGTADLHWSAGGGVPGLVFVPSGSTVRPGESIEILAVLTPLELGMFAGTLTFATDDPDEPILSIDVSAEVLAPPSARIEPAAIEARLIPDDPEPWTGEIRVDNVGSSDLLWSALVGGVTHVGTIHGLWGVDPPPASGGPVSYVYRDGDMPAGPRFEWIEIGGVGTTAPLDGDDETSPPIALGIPFPLFGEVFSTLRISTNGWMSFTSDSVAYANPETLPDASFTTPAALIAPFFDDLDLGGEPTIRYHADGERFIVQYDRVSRYGSPAELTFQVVLFPSGRIVFQYRSMSGTLDSATIGIQDSQKVQGLLVSADEVYVHDGLAVEILPVADWAVLEPTSGVTTPGSSTPIAVSLSGSLLNHGRYHAVAAFVTNDPGQSVLELPIELLVDHPPLAEAGVEVLVECSSPLGAAVPLDASGSADADSAPGTNDDIIRFEWFLESDLVQIEGPPLATGETTEARLPPGQHRVRLEITDSLGLVDDDLVSVTVLDAGCAGPSVLPAAPEAPTAQPARPSRSR